MQDEMTIDKRRDAIFFFIVFAVYTSICAGRYSFNASNVSIIGEYGFSKAQAGSVWTFFEIAYGTGQFIAAAFSHRINQRKFVFGALMLASLAAIAIPFVSSIYAMQAIWFLNGAVQSVVWSAVIKTLSQNVSQRALPNAIVLASITYPIGNFVSYLLAAGSSHINNWRLTFFISAAFMVASAIVWIKGYKKSYYDNPVHVVEKKEKSKGEPKRKNSIAMIITLFVIVSFLGYFIKDGVITWLPSMMHEAFGMEKSSSLFMTLALPFVGAFAAVYSKFLYRKGINHSAQLMLAMGITAAFACCVLYSLNAHIVIWSLVSCIIIFFFMAQITNVVTSMAPLNFRDKADSGFFAGFASGCGHLGSAIGTLILGRVADKSGWNGVFITVLAIALISVVISVFGIVRERRIA